MAAVAPAGFNLDIKEAFCCAALWSLMAQSVVSRRRSKRSLLGVKRTSGLEGWPTARALAVLAGESAALI
jgi:hypothetical protein